MYPKTEKYHRTSKMFYSVEAMNGSWILECALLRTCQEYGNQQMNK